ncbi:hypothetical protein V4B17_05350 [Bartonella sp. B23]
MLFLLWLRGPLSVILSIVMIMGFVGLATVLVVMFWSVQKHQYAL